MITKLGIGSVNAELRKQILVLTAMVNECSYCAAHSAGMGDAFRGSTIHTDSIRILPEELNEKERAVMRLVVAAMKVPSKVTDRMREDVILHYGSAGLENIITIMAWMGKN
ncbi:hypothetical protein HK096_004678 [Nowakowskiella sp. JEL0078]|nr:hypothetical protein HK096_004678 [Nowakowskiella sp. JEL0078]